MLPPSSTNIPSLATLAYLAHEKNAELTDIKMERMTTSEMYKLGKLYLEQAAKARENQVVVEAQLLLNRNIQVCKEMVLLRRIAGRLVNKDIECVRASQNAVMINSQLLSLQKELKAPYSPHVHTLVERIRSNCEQSQREAIAYNLQAESTLANLKVLDIKIHAILESHKANVHQQSSS